LTRKAWEEIAGIEPLLLLIAEEDAVPAELRSDPRVRPFAPVSGLHTAFQAQCIRLLYPALVETTGAVLISDIDLFPLNPRYFHDPVARLDERFFVTYRDGRLARREVAMAFNAALPSTWGELFEVGDLSDVRSVLARWAERGDYDGL